MKLLFITNTQKAKIFKNFAKKKNLMPKSKEKILMPKSKQKNEKSEQKNFVSVFS